MPNQCAMVMINLFLFVLKMADLCSRSLLFHINLAVQKSKLSQ